MESRLIWARSSLGQEIGPGFSRLRHLALAFPVLSAACTNPGPNPYVQPQTVSGPCTVKSFFIVPLRVTPTEMKIENAGEPCAVSMFNPVLGAVQDAAFVTARPAHGQVVTQVQGGNRGSVIVIYKPEPGYSGADSFGITFEPEARDVVFNVIIPPSAASGRGNGGG